MKDKKNGLQTLLAEIGLKASPHELEKYLLLLDELALWNKSLNLTSITDAEEAMEKHIVDSLSLCSVLQQPKFLLDIGSGAGFPSIPLKIARPEIEIFSVEASRKKVHFQRHIVRKLGLRGFTVIHSRIEDLKRTIPDLPAFDHVVSRALAPLGDFLAWARPYVSDSGSVIAMKGPGKDDELDAVSITGDWIVKDQRSFKLPASGSVRQLLIFKRARTSLGL